MSTEPDAITRVARDLTAIDKLMQRLEDQAIHKANDRENLPGGDAMVALGPVASSEAWTNVFDTAERMGWDTSYGADNDEDWSPPLQLIGYWTERIRTEHGHDYGQTPTLTSEVAYLRAMIDWLYDNDNRFQRITTDIKRARARLEDVLHAGERAEIKRVVCANPECPRHPRLMRIYANNPTDDFYKCPACKWHYDDDAFSRAYAKQLQSVGAERFVRIADAVDILKAQGRKETTVREWIAEGMVDLYCDRNTRQVHAYWPDLWRLHLTTANAKAAAKKVVA